MNIFYLSFLLMLEMGRKVIKLSLIIFYSVILNF